MNYKTVHLRGCCNRSQDNRHQPKRLPFNQFAVGVCIEQILKVGIGA